MSDVVIVSTGIANIASVRAGFRRVGASSVVSSSPEEIRDAERVMLPGVGAFAAGMTRLRDTGVVEVLRERAEADRPTMAICLGLQLFASSSEESPGVEGLSVFEDAHVTEFSPAVRVPQLGWNEIRPAQGARYVVEPGYAYFANSYRIQRSPEGWAVATSEYDGSFVAAAERGALLACQFHPELSGPWGLSVLHRWYSGG